MGSNCRRMTTSKFLCKALSTVQSSTSSPLFAFLSSAMFISTHSRTAFWISLIRSVIGTSNSITSAFFRPSKDSATETWNLGHSDGFRRKRFRIVFARGAKPVVNGSGLSENAFKKPTLLSWRYSRIMKASREVAMTLNG